MAVIASSNLRTDVTGSPELHGERVRLRRPHPNDYEEFAAMVRGSAPTLRPWVEPPSTPYDFEQWVRSCDGRDSDGFLVTDAADATIIGAVDLNAITRGIQQSAQIAYYMASDHLGRGLMTESVGLVLAHAFHTLGLHRIEANVQPENARSRRVVQRLGFRREGFSPRLRKLAGEWRDHERWALLREEWQPDRRLF